VVFGFFCWVCFCFVCRRQKQHNKKNALHTHNPHDLNLHRREYLKSRIPEFLDQLSDYQFFQ
jgi:hypothetical protein